MKTYKSYHVTLPSLHPGQEKLFNLLKEYRFVTACCVPPETLILGSNKRISEIEEGDFAISQNGSLTRILKKLERNYSGPLIKIKARYLHPIKATPEHPILVSRVIKNENSYAKKAGTRPHKTTYKPQPTEWIDAGDLDERVLSAGKNDIYCLCVPIIKGTISTNGWELPEQKKKFKSFKDRFPLNKSSAWLLGLYVAEGYIDRSRGRHRSVGFCLGGHETELLKKLEKIILELGFEICIGKPVNGSITSHVYSAQLARLFEVLCRSGATDKQVPNEILFHSDKEILEAFLEGYWDGDGYSKGRTHQAKTVSKTLNLQLQLIFARLGTFASVWNIPPRDEVIQGRAVKSKEIFGLQKAKQSEKRQYLYEDENFVYVPIESVSSEDYEGTVFNISCEDETFLVSNAVTHNCGRRWGKTVGALIIMFYKVLEQPNYIAWWVAPSYRISKRAYRLFKTICDKSLISYISDTDMYIKLINGSVIEFKSSDRCEALLGEGLNFVIFDEMAEAKPESWYMYLSPALSDKRGQALFLSRPHGNWFYDLCEEVGSSDDGIVVSFESRENPYFPPEEWEAAKRRLPPAIFQAEYMAQWIKGASAVFPYAKDVLVKVVPTYRCPTVIGVDPGRTRDFFAISIVNIRRQIIYLAHYRGMPFNEQIDVIRTLSKKYDGHVYIDSHVLGYGLYDMLRASDVGSRITAWPIKDPKARALAIETLALELDPSRPDHFTLPSDFPQECQGSFDELMKELSSMDYKFMPNGTIKYETGSGIHDDFLIALGLAAIGLNERFARVIQLHPTPVKRYNKPEVKRRYHVERKYSKRVAARV